MTPPAAPPGTESAVGFTDARGCKEWLNGVPLTNIPQAQAMVLEMLRALNDAPFDGLERLKCMELLRDKVAFLQGEQRARYFGKSLPLSANDAAAWATGAALLEAMERGYGACLDAANADATLAAHRALIAQRAIRYLGLIMQFHGLVYRRFDASLWTRLHARYGAAESAALTDESVKDSLEGGEDGRSSVLEAYVRAVLLQSACPVELTAAQVDFADALLAMWARKVQVLPAEGASPSAHALFVDLGQAAGATARSSGSAGARLLELEALSRSVRKRIHGLENDEEPAKLGLPAQASGLDAIGQLRRLHRLWCEGAASRPAGKPSELAAAGLVFTLPEIHFFLSGGKVFEQPDRPRELTSQEKQEIEVFGRVTERTHSRMQADHNYQVESWAVIEEMPGMWRLQRPASANKGVAVGRLAAIRLGDTAPFYLATIAGLMQEGEGRIVALLSLFPGRPEAIAVRGVDSRTRAGSTWVQAFRLPPLERLKIPASLIVPVGLAARGRGIETWASEVVPATVSEVLERGADYERVTLA